MKGTNRVLLIFVMISGILAFSCRPIVHLDKPENYGNINALGGEIEWLTIFEGFWTGMNTNYAFWDIDTTDWDAVYDEYLPKFKDLGLVEEDDGATVDTAGNYFSEMLKDIVDGHYSLTGSEELKGSDGNPLYINPSANRLRNQYSEAGADYNKSDRMAERSIKWDAADQNELINTEFLAAVKNEIDGEYCGIILPARAEPLFAATGYKKEESGAILYLHFDKFRWSELFDSFYSLFPNGNEDGLYLAIDEALRDYGGEPDSVREVLNSGYNSPTLNLLAAYLEMNYTSFNLNIDKWKEAVNARGPMDHFYYFFDQLEERQLKDGTPVIGAVIDLRGNTGGDTKDLSTLWGRIVPHDMVFAKKKFKSGENRLDYTPLIDFTIFKAPETAGVTDIPIALVVNKFSVSCAEITAMFYKTLPNGYVVGGTTWGGLGNVVSIGPAILNGGQFSVSDYIESVFTPFCQVLTLQGESFEGKGVPPDYPVPFVYENMMAGIDDRLKKAIEVVLTN